MADPAEQDQSSRALKRLTLAVWVLVVISILNLAVSIFGAFFPQPPTQRPMTSFPDAPTTAIPDSIAIYSGFHNWPTEKKVKGASVIALTTHRIEKGMVKSFISEILKQTPGTTFYYKVGDEYGSYRREVSEDTRYGEGQVMFFTGSPAQFRFGTTYMDGRLLSLGDMPLELLRKLIEEQK